MWESFIGIWFNLSESIDVICVFVAVGLLIYSLVKVQKRASGIIISISFVSWFLLAMFLSTFKESTTLMITWFLSLAVKDAVFGTCLRLLDKKSRLPIPYFIQSVITLLTLIALNRVWVSASTTGLYLVPLWSLLYASLMVLKLIICYSEIKHDGARPILIVDTFLLFLSRNARKSAHAFVGFHHESKAK